MRYTTPAAFRQALDAKLREQATIYFQDLAGLQRRVAFERFLVRLFQNNERWVLKGGYALELRLREKARATLDLDLGVPPPPYENLFAALQEVAEYDLGDFFVFRIRTSRTPLQGPPLGGRRFSVEALLGGKPYSRFVVDVGQGDELSETVEWIEGQIDLGFAGLERTRFAVYPLVDHFAEKLHAYTRPRQIPTRVKDLVDMALLLELQIKVSPDLLKTVIAVFKRYATHPLPEVFPLPPAAWEQPFRQMAQATGLEPSDIHHWWGRIEVFYRNLIQQ
jgi:predicted nucleotidyltransferase component of viral defense system